MRLQDPPYLDGMTKLTSFDEIDEVLRSAAFEQGAHQESGPFFHDSLLMIGGDEHFERRRLEAQLFGKEALRYYEGQALEPVISKCMEELDAQRDPTDGLVRADVVALTRTMLHRITAVIVGIDGVDTDEDTELLRWFIEKLGEAVTVEWSTRDHDEVVGEGLAIRQQFIDEFFQPAVDRRLALIEQHKTGELETADLPRDLITLMYSHWDDAWDDDIVLREATLYMVAATQTTTHAAPHVIAHLAEWFEQHPDDAERTSDLDFLRRSAAESLRLHLPSPALLRRATVATTLASGRAVAAGERVALLFHNANRDAQHFGDDSQDFDPFRTVESTSAKPWGLTFGGGEHLCIGRPLVTGVAGRGEDDGTGGTIVQILAALYRSGAQLDPARPPEFTATSHHDAYSTFPVILAER